MAMASACTPATHSASPITLPLGVLTRTLSPLTMPRRAAVWALSRTPLLGCTWRRRSEPMLMELMVWDL
ncbi:hypothetical protein D3C85_992830 [compost metagenome]